MRTTALILAAGASRRAGGVNKLLARDRSGRCMIVRTVDAVLRSRVDEAILVLGPDAAGVAAAVEAAVPHPGAGRLRLTYADRHGEGLSASLRHGVSLAMAGRADAVLICLGDMPLVLPETLDRLMAELAEDASALACVPVVEERWGNPVIWRRPLFGELLSLSGDRGGRPLLERHALHVRKSAFGDPGVLEDFDTPERLASYAML